MRPVMLRLAPVATIALLLVGCTTPAPSGTKPAGSRPSTVLGEAALAAPNAAPPATRRDASNGPVVPRVRARSAIVIDMADGSVVFARHAGQQRPIASI